MPYLEMPHLANLRMFYVCNPKSYANFSLSTDPTEPDSLPLDESKPTLLFVHAGTMSHASFLNQYNDPRLAVFNLIGMDGRFHGRSTGDEVDQFTLEDSADSFICAMDMLGVKTYSVVGEGGHGSSVAVWMAWKRPQQVECLILASPGPYLISEQPRWNERKKWWLDSVYVNKDGHGDGTGAIGQDAVDFLALMLFGVSERDERYRDAWISAFQRRYGAGKTGHDLQHIVSDLMGRNVQHLTVAQRASVTAPVLILQGTGDKGASTQEDATSWQNGFTSARGGAVVHIIASAPHLIYGTEYSIANRMIVNFIQRHVPKPVLSTSTLPSPQNVQ